MKLHGGCSESSSPLRRIQNNASCKFTLKLRPSSTPQQMELSKSREQGQNLNDFNFTTNLKDGSNAIGTCRSRGIKGVKEDCERFRLQMKILKEKAYDSRIREDMVEGMVENLHNNINKETIKTSTLDANDVANIDEKRKKNILVFENFVDSIENLSSKSRITSNFDGINDKFNQHNEESIYASTMINRRSKSLPKYNISFFERKNNRQNNAYEDFKARKRMKTYDSFSSYSNTSNSSTSSTTSSLSFLPLSHYIQKLKYLAPISWCPSNPSTNVNKNLTSDEILKQSTLDNEKSFRNIASTGCQNIVQDLHIYTPSSTSNPIKLMKSIENQNNMQVDVNTKNHLSNTYLDTNIHTLIPSTSLHTESSRHVGIYACQRAKKPTSFKSNNIANHGDQRNRKVNKINCTNFISLDENKYSNLKSLEPNNTMDGVIHQHSNKDNRDINHEDTSLHQIIFNELRGLMKDFNIQIEVEIKSLKNEFEDLEKQLDHSKRKMSKEMFEIRSQLQNDIELKLEEAIISLLKKKEINNDEIEIEKIRRLVEKAQEDNAKLERSQSVTHMEGIQERMLIMERVESVSQLYLGGLEEIRSNVSNIKISCRDRVDELEGQWNEFRRHQECYAIKHHHVLTKNMLMNELENIHIEVAKIVETKQEHTQELLERESAIIQSQFLTMCATNKREIVNTMKGELNKRLQIAQNKVLLMTDAMKQEMDNLRCEIKKGHESAEGLSKIIPLMEKETKIATQAATKATISATNAKDMINEMRKSFEIEIANAQHISLQLQEELLKKEDLVQSVAIEAHKTTEELIREKEQMWLIVSATQAKNLDFNELLQNERSNIVKSVAAVQKDRDVASQATQEVRCLALKASAMLAEFLKSFNGEMTKAHHMNMQLLKGLEREKEDIKRERDITLQFNQEAQDSFSKELELAIKSWKHAMNVEITKAKEVTFSLEEEQQQVIFAKDQSAMLYLQLDCVQADMEAHISKTHQALTKLGQSIHQLQDARDKHQCLLVNGQELEQFKKNWQGELSYLQQMMQMLEKKLKEIISEQFTCQKRIEMVEKVQVNLVQSYEDVQISTSNLEKTATIWLPKYEAAARIVNELSTKVERMDEQIQLTCGDKSLVQQITCVVESKVNGMKDMVISSHLKDIDIEVKGLLERVNTKDCTDGHAIGVLESRVSTLENSLSHDSNVSLKLEYIKKSGKDGGDKNRNMPSLNHLNQNIKALRRKLEIMAAQCNEFVTLESNRDFNSKIISLENRIEHVASATFTNLRLLDKKVEHVTTGVRFALNGAMVADKKCASLGYEFVKAFRMFTNKKDVQGIQENCHVEKDSKEYKASQPYVKGKRIYKKQDVNSYKQSTIDGATECFQNTSKPNENHRCSSTKTNTFPQKMIKRRMPGLVKDISQIEAVHPSQIQKSNSHLKRERGNEDFCGFKGGNLLKSKTKSLQDSSIGAIECKLHGPLSIVDECRSLLCTNLDGQLIVEKREEKFAKNCQRTNICLEASEIYVNVSHQLGGSNQNSQKMNNLIAVQS